MSKTLTPQHSTAVALNSQGLHFVPLPRVWTSVTWTGQFRLSINSQDSMATSLRPLRPSESAQEAFPRADCRVGRPPSSPLPLLISNVANIQAACGNECKERRFMWLKNCWEDWVTGKFALYPKVFPNNPPRASDHTLRNAATSPASPKTDCDFLI